jgi:glyoxylase-like metal-dependent hydrolase (beta-lactamase superfamily II)
VTDDPVTALVYSHIHKDHIAGAGPILTPDTAIYAEAGAAGYLKAKQDPARPLPRHVHLRAFLRLAMTTDPREGSST